VNGALRWGAALNEPSRNQRLRLTAPRPGRSLYETFVEMPLKRQPYGDWEFEVRDPNGYVLVFGDA
jgi:hypothetical protein